MDWKLEVVVVPVTDVDRSKRFYVSRSVPPRRRHPAHRDDAGGADDASGIDMFGDHRTRPHAAR